MKKFWKKNDCFIRNPNGHFVRCEICPCKEGNYYAIFAIKSRDRGDGCLTISSYDFQVRPYLVQDGKIKYNDKCVLINKNGRPNGKLIVPSYYGDITSFFYRISKVFYTLDELKEALFTPCGITENFPEIWTSYGLTSLALRCLQSRYWLLKCVRVSAPVFNFCRSTCSISIECNVNGYSEKYADSSFLDYTYYTNDEGDFCYSNTSGCTPHTIQTVSYYSPHEDYTFGVLMHQIGRNGRFFNYQWIQLQDWNPEDEYSWGCRLNNACYKTGLLLSPYIEDIISDKSNYTLPSTLQRYALSGGYNKNTYISAYISLGENYPYFYWVDSGYGRSQNTTCFSGEYRSYPHYENGSMSLYVDTTWMRFKYNSTSGTLSTALGIRALLLVLDYKIDTTISGTTLIDETTVSSYTSSYISFNFNQWYEELPLPTYCSTWKVIKLLTCNSNPEELGDSCVQEDDGCLLIYLPGKPGTASWGPEGCASTNKHERITFKITDVDYIFDLEYINNGYDEL